MGVQLPSEMRLAFRISAPAFGRWERMNHVTTALTAVKQVEQIGFGNSFALSLCQLQGGSHGLLCVQEQSMQVPP